jgi:hypothetical protein
MSGGGKGGSTTSTVEVPAWLEGAARSNLAKADTLSRIGYTPYYGPDVAAMTPSQMAAIQGTNTAALSFGLPSMADPMAGMGQPLSYGGIPAYSSGGMYDQALAELQRRQPGQYNALRAPFIDPVTGAQPAAPFGFGGTGPGVLDMGMAAPSPVVAPVVRDGGGGGGGGGGGSMSSGMSAGGGTGSFGLPDPMSGRVSSVGGFTSIRDMFDGGGAGQSGTTFSGGPLSGILNTVGVSPAKPAPAPAPVAAPARTAPSVSVAPAFSADRAAAANRVADQSLAGKAAVQAAKEVGKAAQANRAADKAIADKAKSQANKEAASKAKSEASQGKGGKSGPSGGGSKSGGSGGRR